MNGLADIDGFKICIQVCVWLGFPPLKTVDLFSRHGNLCDETNVELIYLRVHPHRAAAEASNWIY